MNSPLLVIQQVNYSIMVMLHTFFKQTGLFLKALCDRKNSLKSFQWSKITAHSNVYI